MRTIKVIDAGEDRGLVFVAQTRKGTLESWTLVPTTNRDYINRQRAEKLIYGR